MKKLIVILVVGLLTGLSLGYVTSVERLVRETESCTAGGLCGVPTTATYEVGFPITYKSIEKDTSFIPRPRADEVKVNEVKRFYNYTFWVLSSQLVLLICTFLLIRYSKNK